MVNQFSYRNSVLFASVLGIILIDQATKYLIRSFLNPSEHIPLIPKILSLTYVTNTGASFGILKGMNVFLIVISMCIVAYLVYYTYRHRSQNNDPHFLPFALIIGGALSNIIDRLAYGFVLDFIQIPFWPAFNVADSVITLGVLVLIIQSLRNKE